MIILDLLRRVGRWKEPRRPMMILGYRTGRGARRPSTATTPDFAPLEVRKLLTALPALHAPFPWAVEPTLPATNPPGAGLPPIRPSFPLDSPSPPAPRLLLLNKTGTFLIPPGGPNPQTASAPQAAKLAPNPTNPGLPHGPPPGDRSSLAEASTLIKGVLVPELAFANEATGTVSVVLGHDLVFRQRGLGHPESVKLADLDQDGNLELIVADSGNNRVLVYQGLSGGRIGAEANGGQGFGVGVDPVGLTVGDINGDGRPDLLVANLGSNDVSTLLGTGSGRSWTLQRGGDIHAGDAPVRTLLVNPRHDSSAPYLLVCNSGSNDVYLYPPAPGGRFGAEPPRIFDVGDHPTEMFVGAFSHHAELDLVTLNSGSRNLTYIGGVFANDPVRQEINTGSASPLSAFVLTTSLSGTTDLMVATSDGGIAYLQAGDDGPLLAGLYTPTDIGTITAIATGELTSAGLAIYEASTADDDSVAIAQYNLGDASFFTVSPSLESPLALSPADDRLAVALIPNGGSLLDLVSVLWNGSDRSRANDPSPADPRAIGSRPTNPASQSLTPGDDDTGSFLVSSRAIDDDDLAATELPTSWTGYVLGLDAAFDALGGEVAALADSDTWHGVESVPSFAPAIRRLADFDRGATPANSWEAPEWSRTRPARNKRKILARSASVSESSDVMTAAVGSAVAVRLLVNASPPRPPRVRSERRAGSSPAWPEIVPPTSPHG